MSRCGLAHLTSRVFPLSRQCGQDDWGKGVLEPLIPKDSPGMLPHWEPVSGGLEHGRHPQETKAWPLSLKGWSVNILSFAGCTVSVATSHSALGAGK